MLQRSRGTVKSEGRILALDWSPGPAVEGIPGKVGGAWVFKGTRMPVSVVFENLEDGMSIERLMEQFPVSREQVKAVLEFAACGLAVPVSRPPQRHVVRLTQ
jgi:uncharacterized protein (DUF433 family)